MRTGQQAPGFELPDQQGRTVRLADLTAAGPAVVFFYPVALSGGCTEELNRFTELAPEFASLCAAVAGVSKDSVARQAEFARRVGAGFPLLSDPEERVIADYGAKRRFLAKVLPVKRCTFVISSTGEILSVTTNETDMAIHADHALQVVRAAAKGQQQN